MGRNPAALSCHIRHLVLHLISLMNFTLGKLKETDERCTNPQRLSSLTHPLIMFNIPSSCCCNSSVITPPGSCKIQHLYWIPAIIQQGYLDLLIYKGSQKKKKKKSYAHGHSGNNFVFCIFVFGKKYKIIYFNLCM